MKRFAIASFEITGAPSLESHPDLGRKCPQLVDIRLPGERVTGPLLDMPAEGHCAAALDGAPVEKSASQRFIGIFGLWADASGPVGVRSLSRLKSFPNRDLNW
jgi:hypothetical protein